MKKEHGVYGCYNQDGILVYVGSSGVTLTRLESNHRNYHNYKNGKPTKFRLALKDKGQDWTFQWIVPPTERSRAVCERIEGDVIRELRPEYNKDLHPYETSVRYGRLK